MNVLIVGGTSSVGLACVAAFERARARILATSRAPPMPQRDVPGVQWVALDLDDPGTLAPCIGEIERFGAIDVAVLLPSILPGLSLADYDRQRMDEVMSVNFTAQADLVRRLMPCMAPRSQVVLMASVSGQRGSFDPIYAASKAALIGFMRSLAVWRGSDIRFNAIAPALIEGSDMYLQMAPSRREHHRQSTPTGRLTTLEELAELVVQLTGPAFANVNGQVIAVNGGSHV